MSLVEQCYASTSRFPKAEAFGLTGRIRRAATSIPANLAEGYSRRSTKAYAFHVTIALGSHAELETCLELAMRLGILPSEEHKALVPILTSVGRHLSRLHQSLDRKIAETRG